MSRLELSQLCPDVNPPALPHSKILSSSIKPEVISKEKPQVQVGGIHWQRNDLVSNEVMLGSTAKDLRNGPALVRPNDFPFQLFEKKDCAA